MREFLLAFVATGLVLTAGVLAAGACEPPQTPTCTEADGACLTWDDIREQPLHHQEN